VENLGATTIKCFVGQRIKVCLNGKYRLGVIERVVEGPPYKVHSKRKAVSTNKDLAVCDERRTLKDFTSGLILRKLDKLKEK